MQYSLKWLLLCIAFVGFASTALAIGTRPLAITSMLMTVAVLLAAVVSYGVSQGSKRAFCFGFIVFGFGYLGMLYMPSLEMDLSPINVFENVLNRSHPLIVRDVATNWDPVTDPQMSSLPTGTQIFGDSVEGYTYKLPVLAYYRAIGHMVFAILVALIGGGLGQYLHYRANTAN